MYVGTIFIDVDGEISKCEVEVEIELLGTEVYPKSILIFKWTTLVN